MHKSGSDRKPDILRIDLSDSIDRWRYTCPNRHTIGEIDAYTDTYYCPSCSRTHGIQTTTWDYIIDRRTNEEIPFEHVLVSHTR